MIEFVKRREENIYFAVLAEWLRHLTGNQIPFGSICATVRYCPIDRLKKGREENSLGVLTKQFIHLIQKADNQIIDLNDAVK